MHLDGVILVNIVWVFARCANGGFCVNLLYLSRYIRAGIKLSFFIQASLDCKAGSMFFCPRSVTRNTKEQCKYTDIPRPRDVLTARALRDSQEDDNAATAAH